MTRWTRRLARCAWVGAMTSVAACFAANAEAQPTLRVTVDQPGDFVMIGNSLGYDCASAGTPPTVGTIGACGLSTSTPDTAPDVYWRSDDQNGTATASTAITPSQARSTAMLNLPAGATVTHAFLYWAGETSGLANVVDNGVTFERPDGAGGTVFTTTATAQVGDQYGLLATINGNARSYFQAVADVTALVNQHGAGAYRVTGLDLTSWVNYVEEVTFASWSLIVFYEDLNEPPRNLTLFDGLDLVGNNSSETASLSGFLVPDAGFDAKLGVIAYEGDDRIDGDRLLFGQGTLDPIADALQNGLNPSDDFFNSTRSFLGLADSNSGDLPQLAGSEDTMGSVDMDVIDITSRVSPGQTSADIEASSVGDVYFLGAFVTSISTYEPNLTTSSKDVVDVDGVPLVVGDEMLYTITVTNTGNDNAIDTVLSDQLPAGVSYVAGSLQITDGPNMGALTDASGDDQGEYDGGSNTVTVRLGTGADDTSGGVLSIGETTIVSFSVTVDAGTTGTISNQAEITYAGEQGAPLTVVPTDGNGPDIGTPPTDVEVNECEVDTDCGGANNGQVCDTDQGYVCVPGCRGIGNESGCPNGDMCTSMDATIGDCVPGGSGGAGGSGSASGGAGGATSGGVDAGAGGAAMAGGGTSEGGDDGGVFFDDGNVQQSGSCGCRIPADTGDTPWQGLTALGLLGLLVTRRRR